MVSAPFPSCWHCPSPARPPPSPAPALFPHQATRPPEMFQAHPVLQPREKVLGFSMGFPARLSPPGCLSKQGQSREASLLCSWYPGPQPYNSLAQDPGAAPTSSAVPGQGSFSRDKKGSAPRSFSPSASKALARARRCHSYSDSCRLFIHSFISYGQTAQTSP